MLLVTHQFGFPYRFAPYVIYLYDGEAYGTGAAEQVFRYPRKKRKTALLLRFSEFYL
ncbi:MAG: hypothetical protein ACU0FH_06525 [Heliomarina sp.]|uniref:hypothetical protein n=1 Tax=Heliomarina sp. TaxID=2917556 RepID=UPI00405906E4